VFQNNAKAGFAEENRPRLVHSVFCHNQLDSLRNKWFDQSDRDNDDYNAADHATDGRLHVTLVYLK
jgi:hypothetical protein